MKRFLSALTLIFAVIPIVLLLSCAAPAQAGKATTSVGGEIYFIYQGVLYVMDGDGGNLRLATGFNPAFPQDGIPSRNLHAGKRWLVSWSPGGPVVTSDGGNVVQLRTQFEPEVFAGPYWSADDVAISFLALRWDEDPASATYGEPLEAGIYELGFDVDAAGDITGESGPARLIFELPWVVDSEGETRPDAFDFDWAPDGIQLVYNRIAARQLRIGNVQTGGDKLLYDGANVGGVGKGLWSPAGDRIAFHLSDGYMSVMTIDLVRGRLKQIQTSAPGWTRSAAAWSPTGTHLLLHHRDHHLNDSYILRMTAAGAEKTRLTGSEMGAGLSWPRVRGWR